MKKNLYGLTAGDREIIRASRKTPNIFSNFYLKSPTSGTWWLPGSNIDRLKDGYWALYRHWSRHGKPEAFEFAAKTYTTVLEHERQEDFPGYPAFHHNHGIMMLPFGEEMHLDRTPIRTVVGGFGCIAAGTRIFDVRTRQHIPVEELVRLQQAPVVLAWNGQRLVPVQATVPWVKGQADLYRVVTEAGNQVTTTLDHRFLTTAGWQTLRTICAAAMPVQLLKSDAFRPMLIPSRSGLADEASVSPDRIVSVERVALDTTFYDLHVPGHENYLAEGVIHHNSSKTMSMTLSILLNAATIPEYRCFVLGPYSNQAAEIFKLALAIMSGTEYEKRFFIHSVERPYPKLFIGTEDTGVNSIECYPLNDESALRNLTGDEAVIEQAEHPSLDLDEVLRSVGTRLRGRTVKHGRARLGRVTLIANADDNARLWEIFDMADEDPKHYRSWSPSTYDNPYLTDKDYERFETLVGGSEELKKQYLKGQRPRGNGKHFSRATLDLMEDDRLDWLMRVGLQQQELTAKAAGYIYTEGKGAGVVEWLLPPLDDHDYVVVSDPGTENPPHRDSPPVMVWDVTKFPKQPATLAGFVWVYGNRNIQNWATRYREMVMRYQAVSRNGFDATGYQSGYDQWLMALELLLPEKINLAGNAKALCLNSAKMLTTAGLMKLPKAISAIYDQLSRYEYPPEPKHLRQDLVMCFIMSAWYLQRFFYVMEGEFNERPGYDPNDRYFRPERDRYGDHIR